MAVTFLESSSQSFLDVRFSRNLESSFESNLERNYGKLLEPQLGSHFQKSFAGYVERTNERNFERSTEKNLERTRERCFEFTREHDLEEPEPAKEHCLVITKEHDLEENHDHDLEEAKEHCKALDKKHEFVKDVKATNKNGEVVDVWYDYEIDECDNFAVIHFDYDLPRGWEHLKTDKNRDYFVDHNQKQTMWANPISIGTSVECIDGQWNGQLCTLVKKIKKGKSWMCDFNFDIVEEVKVVNMKIKSVPAEKDGFAEGLPEYHRITWVLPPGWRAASNKAGRTYYINDKTKETSWAEPQRVKSTQWHGMVGTAAERKLRRHQVVHDEKNARLTKERKEREKRALAKNQLRDDRALRQAKSEADKRAKKLQVQQRKQDIENERGRRGQERYDYRKEREMEMRGQRKKAELDKNNRQAERRNGKAKIQQERGERQAKTDAMRIEREEEIRQKRLHSQKQQEQRERNAQDEQKRRQTDARRREEQRAKKQRDHEERIARERQEAEDRQNKNLQKQRAEEKRREKEQAQQMLRIGALLALEDAGMGIPTDSSTFEAQVTRFMIAQGMPGKFTLKAAGAVTVSQLIRDEMFEAFDIFAERAMKISTWKEMNSQGFKRKEIEAVIPFCSSPAELVQMLRQKQAVEKSKQQAQTISAHGNPANNISFVQPNFQQQRLTTTPGLPYGWEAKWQVSGQNRRLYYVNHHTKQTTYDDPRPLPQGWILKKDGQRPYFVDHSHGQTTWTDPRPIVLRGQGQRY